MAEIRDIKYLNRDFGTFKQDLIDLAKSYFPNTYNDFSDDNPGAMFIEMAAYVGDVLSFYQDSQLQENILLFARDKQNLLAMAYSLGYRPKVTSTATVDLDVYQLVPAVSGEATPDFRYALIIDKEATVQSRGNSSVNFITRDDVNFAFSSSYDPTDVSVYQINTNTNLPDFYLLKKKVKAISGTVQTTTFSFGAPTKFPVVRINDTNIIQILDVVDSDGNKWYEVPYLAQSTIFEAVQNNEINDPNLSQYQDSVPYLLRLKKVPRRFVSCFTDTDTLELEFGAGTLDIPDEEVIPNPDNIGIGLIDGISKLNTAFDPSNFLFTRTYGLAPANTTLTVRYLVGGGVSSNVPSEDLTNITGINARPATFNTTVLNGNLLNNCIRSIAVSNPEAAKGGGDGDSVEDLRLNSLATHPSQMRTVTKDDYMIRALSLPSQFGSISKAYITQNKYNNFMMDLYVLAYDNNRNIINASDALKENLKTYISEFKMPNDVINIKDGFYINIGVNFEIVVLPAFNAQQILLSCVDEVKKIFDIDRWQINQPIIISEVFAALAKIKGVQNVQKVEIINKSGTNLGYSPFAYDIKGATKNNVVYPSIDPAVFEIRFPDSDISGKVVNY